MEELKTDVTIIGSGPAGQKAAIQAAKSGKRVKIIEQFYEPGGNCLFSGTIPSKTLREAIIDLTRFYERHFVADETCWSPITIHDLSKRLQQVIEDEKNMLHRQFRRNGIELIQGTAQFEDPHSLVILDEDFEPAYRVQSENFIIATGSKPRRPDNVPFDKEVILDSTTLLNLEEIPKSMIVLGGGIIGSEYASFFAALGTEVTIVDKKEQILPLLDKEIGIHLQTALSDIGMKFLGNKRPQKIERRENRAFVTFDDGTTATADTLLFALGRTSNVHHLSIEKAGIKLNERGYVTVNALFQTSQSHIYAVGDVIGGPSLASTSMEQGRLAARHAVGAETHHFPTLYPIGIYTIPEISSCGKTEEELKALGYNYEVGRAYYYEIARSHIAGSHTGMVKIIFHKETLEILGVHVIGRGATEVIHIGQVAMSFGAKIDYFIDQIFNYPTYAEGYRVAALNGYNKVKR